MRRLLNNLNIFRRVKEVERETYTLRIDEVNNCGRVEGLAQKIRQLDEQIKTLHNQQKYIMETIDVGVDVHTKSNSWAVICVGGKKEYIKFFEIPTKENAIQLRSMLRDFEKSNLIVDSNPFLTI